MSGRTLSLPAELALLGFDPATCTWFPTERRRRRTAFGAAAVYQSAGMPRSARALRRLGKRTEKAAMLELRQLRIVDGKRLINRVPLARRFERLLTVLRQGDFDREYDRSLIAVLAWAEVLEPRLRGRSTRWFSEVMREVVGEPDDEPDRVLDALRLACDGDVLGFLLEEAEDLSQPPSHDHPHVPARQSEGVFSGGGT